MKRGPRFKLSLPDAELRAILENNSVRNAKSLLGVAGSTVYQYAARLGITMKRYGSYTAEDARVILSLFQQGASMRLIAQKIDRNAMFVAKVLREVNARPQQGEDSGIYSSHGWPAVDATETLPVDAFEDVPQQQLLEEARREGPPISGGMLTRAVQHMALSR